MKKTTKEVSWKFWPYSMQHALACSCMYDAQIILVKVTNMNNMYVSICLASSFLSFSSSPLLLSTNKTRKLKLHVWKR